MLLSFFGIIKIIKEDHVNATLETKCTECDEFNWGRSKDKDKCDDQTLKCIPLHKRLLEKDGINISMKHLNKKLETFITGNKAMIKKQFVASGGFNSVFKIDMDNDKHIVVRLTKYCRDFKERERIRQDEINGLHFQRAVDNCHHICNVYDYGKFHINGGELLAFLDPFGQQSSLLGVYGILEYNDLSLYDYITNKKVNSTDFNYSLEYSMNVTDGPPQLLLEEWSKNNKTNGFHKKVQFVYELKEQLFSALECIHRNNYLHMDLKPENIMLKIYPNLHDMKTVQIKLIDFGLSCKKNEKRTGIRGTRLYLPPKKWTSYDNFTTEWDIWATGRILYECLFPAVVQDSLTNPFDTAANKKLLSTKPQLIQERAHATEDKDTRGNTKLIGAYCPDMPKIKLAELIKIDQGYYSLLTYHDVDKQYNNLYEIFEKIFDKKQYTDSKKKDRQIIPLERGDYYFTKDHITNHVTPRDDE